MGCALSDENTTYGVRANKKMKKIQAVDDSDQLLENLERRNRVMDTRSFKVVSQALKKHFYFFSLSSQQIEEVQKKMFYCDVAKDQYIFKKGDAASCYMIIENGQVIIEEFRKVLKKGDSFGQLALIYNSPRSASVKSLKNVGLWCLSRTAFKKTMTDLVEKCYEVARPYMDRIRIFKFLTARQKDAISHAMVLMKFQPGEYIFKQNEQASTFAIVKEGNINIQIDKKEINKLKQGDSFGEQAFIQHSKRTASAVALDKVIILSIQSEDVQRILGAEILKVVRYNLHKWAVNNSAVLGALTSIQIDRMINEVEIKMMKADDLIFSKGEICSKLVFMTDNTLIDSKKNVISDRGSLFGDKYLLEINQNSKMDDYLYAGADGVVGFIPFAIIRKQNTKPLQQVLSQNKQSKIMKATLKQKKTDFSGLQLDNMMILKKLGEGQFGKVFLIKSKNSDQLFALKCIQKQQIIENKMEKITVEEKQILQVIDNPFIMKYCRSFKDDYYVYLLLEHVRGIELFDVLREIGLVKKPLAKFYIGSLLIAIEYLHSNNIIYRDLKPENVMVESNGYLRLIDLGTAKRLLASKGFRTFTMIGTPHYMGPEVLQGKGYTFTTDLWSVGVMMYQFLCGELPYAQNLDDPYDIYYEVMKNTIKFPSGLNDIKAIRLIEQLMNKTPENRLGRSYATLKNNGYFDDMDWQALYNKKIQPPFYSEYCRKEEESIKKLSDGKAFTQEMVRERKGLKRIPVSKWDSQF